MHTMLIRLIRACLAKRCLSQPRIDEVDCQAIARIGRCAGPVLTIPSSPSCCGLLSLSVMARRSSPRAGSIRIGRRQNV